MDTKILVYDGIKHIETIIQAQEKRKELGIELDDFVIISVGELNANKNHEIVIKAIKKVNDLHIKYIICGQGKLEKYLIQKIKQYQLENQVMLLGYRTDVKELLSMSDLFAFPSLREGLSMSLMEAMASGLPVICGEIRGNNDLIEEDRGGYLIIGNNIDQYVSAIKKIKSEDNIRAAMRKYNQVKIRRFSKNQVNRIMKNVYRNTELCSAEMGE